tara:strand:- start:32217 stop:32960 length:744 start_codon:yes stop_codon:yes gene_type:complete
MRGCIGIIARVNSTRLSEKHFIKINRIPILSYLLKRILFKFNDHILSETLDLIILTGSKRLNHKFEYFKKKFNLNIFYGDENNIPLRIYNALSSNKYSYILLIEGDDILTSMDGARLIHSNILKHVKCCKTISYPFGMNSMGFSFDHLNFYKNKFINKKNIDTGYKTVLENNCLIIDKPISWNKNLRFTLDYKEDINFFSKIINSDLKVETATDKDIIDFVIKNKIYKYNSGIIKKYWKNYEITKNE